MATPPEQLKRRKTCDLHRLDSSVQSDVQKVLAELANGLHSSKNGKSSDKLLDQLIQLQRDVEGTELESTVCDALAQARSELQVSAAAASALLACSLSVLLTPHRGSIPSMQGALESLQMALDRCAASSELSASPSIAATPAGVRELIGYAHRLSFTTRAPPGFVPGQSQLGQFQPPAPQELQMRASQLHEFARQAAERQRAATAAAAPPQAAQAAAVATAAAQAELSPDQIAAILATMPPGWKFGDAVPGVPPGAAPGAAPLPAVAAAPAATQPTPPAPPPAPKPPRAVSEELPLPAPPIMSFALNEDLDFLAGLGEDDFGSASEEESSSSSSEEEEEG